MKKISLEKLKVNSFVTASNDDGFQTVKGGKHSEDIVCTLYCSYTRRPPCGLA